ncbi:hypothetical protein [Mycolicibacterium diernhoferi]|nr:hypothetical protein [Mycolicibacterium diernhoferi]QYL23119.1 hypothetical protein K0O62_01835 [Mycolicibacterium diernhoferi]
MPRGKGVYVDDDDSGDDSRSRVADESDVDARTPDVDKPEPGSEPPD